MENSPRMMKMRALLTTIGCYLLGSWGLVQAATPISTAAPAAVPSGAVFPEWPKPVLPNVPAGAPSVRSEDLELSASPDGPGTFAVRVGGADFAVGQEAGLIGYVIGGEIRWFNVALGANHRSFLKPATKRLTVTVESSDPAGGKWRIVRRFSPGQIPGSIEIRTEIGVDQNRDVAFLPMLMLFPGAGSFGSEKEQGLLAGLEYLRNEPSSSEADVRGPASKRAVPDNLKLTFPLMVIQNQGHYLALTWQMRPEFCALYDSPDRLFGSGAHVMGLLFPGSDGKNRQEGSLLPHFTRTLHAGQVLELRATLLGGSGHSVVPAVQQYVALRGLPGVRPSAPDLQPYVTRTAGGWLDSKIREGNLFHHAIAGGNFPAAHAADAAVWMNWLAAQTTNPELAPRLRLTSQAALEDIPAQELNLSGVGHIRNPVASLLFGHVEATADQALQTGRSLLARFEPDLSVRYEPKPGGPDFSSTHFSKQANGLTSRLVLDLLEAAAFSGDHDLIAQALERLRAMNKFDDEVPRGAQTWECPLHTPDILASAQMTRAYTLGYELTGDPKLLERARFWAWTGLPFVYLVNPTAHPIGLYATIAVFGATHWRAPVWLGLPVQWCGLVYADALYRLIRYDPRGPWKRLADGITRSGIDQSWPSDDPERQGLLPDSFVLRSQHRNGPAINPATVEACAVRYYTETPVYDFFCFPKEGIRIHAPGLILDPRQTAHGLSFQVRGWAPGAYFVYLNGLRREPKLRINGESVACTSPNQFLLETGRLILELHASPRIDLEF